jgi:hypothetical protein
MACDAVIAIKPMPKARAETASSFIDTSFPPKSPRSGNSHPEQKSRQPGKSLTNAANGGARGCDASPNDGANPNGGDANPSGGRAIPRARASHVPSGPLLV